MGQRGMQLRGGLVLQQDRHTRIRLYMSEKRRSQESVPPALHISQAGKGAVPLPRLPSAQSISIPMAQPTNLGTSPPAVA
jgi:hypothetical protein